MTRKRRIFVTGAGGTIGRASARVLVSRGYEVVGFGLGEQYYRQSAFFKELQASGAFTFETGSILDRFAVMTAMRGADAVIHLAAMVGNKRTQGERLHCLDINVKGTDHVLAAAVANGVGRFLMVSSSAVYGEPRANPVAEDAEIKPLNVYAVSKLAAEELTRGYAQLHPSLRYTIVRPFNTYGDDPTGHIVLNAFAARVLSGEAPLVNGDGTQRRCYVHADDVAAAFAAMLERPIAENRTYNLGNPHQVFTVRELARKVIASLAPGSGLEPGQGALVLDPGETRDIISDISRAERELDYRPVVTVEEGLRRIAGSQARDVS